MKGSNSRENVYCAKKGCTLHTTGSFFKIILLKNGLCNYSILYLLIHLHVFALIRQKNLKLQEKSIRLELKYL